MQLVAAGGSGGGGWPLSNAEGGGAGARPAAPRGRRCHPRTGAGVTFPSSRAVVPVASGGAGARGGGAAPSGALRLAGGRVAGMPAVCGPTPGLQSVSPPHSVFPSPDSGPAPLLSEVLFSPIPHVYRHFTTPRASLCGPPSSLTTPHAQLDNIHCWQVLRKPDILLHICGDINRRSLFEQPFGSIYFKTIPIL